jgi:Flp pilus assembly protein TadG
VNARGITSLSRLVRDKTGASATEFALVAPAFLMFLFLILDGGRLMFTKQALNELASATARCTAIKANGCTTIAATQNWAAARGIARSMLLINAANVSVVLATNCNGQSNMATVAISMTYKKGALTLLPQSAVPSTLTSNACFPMS